jgi:transcriptional enhancer factor
MPTLDTWHPAGAPGPASAGGATDWTTHSTPAKVEPHDQSAMWAPAQWAQITGAGPGAGPGAGAGAGVEREGSSRPMKRRRGDTIDGHVPVTVTTAW